MKKIKINLKNKYLLFGVFLIILILILNFSSFNSNHIKPIQKPSSYIYSIVGDVQILSKLNKSLAKNNLEIFQNDIIFTGLNSKANLNILKKLNIKINSNTNLELKLIKKNDIEINLINGNIQNLFYGKNLLIKTLNINIFTKSANFNIEYNNLSNTTTIYVNSGLINLSNDKIDLINLEKYDKVKINNSGLYKIKLKLSKKIKIIKTFKNKLNLTKNKRLEIINSHSFVLSTIKNKYDITDNDIKNYLNKIDKGILNDKELAKKSPIQFDDINLILKLNDQIKNNQKEIIYANKKFNLTN